VGEAGKCLVDDAKAAAGEVAEAAGLVLLGPVGMGINIYRGTKNLIALVENAIEGAQTLLDEAKRKQLVEDLKTDEGLGRAVASGIEIGIGVATGGRVLTKLSKNCFIAGTLVWLLKDGMTLEEAMRLLASGAPVWLVADLVPIEYVQAGQYVLSKSDASQTAPLTFSRVAETYVRVASNLVEVGVANSVGTSGTLTVTEEHPIWMSSGTRMAPIADPDEAGTSHTVSYKRSPDGRRTYADHGWVSAVDLRRGDRLDSPIGLEASTVSGTASTTSVDTLVYNLNVDGTNTYFVSPANAPDLCVWVHNGKYTTNGGGGPKQTPHTRNQGATPSSTGANAPTGLTTPKRYSPAKEALVDMAKSDKRKGITCDDMKAYQDLNKELPDPFIKDRLELPEPNLTDTLDPSSTFR
jgi:hypothetical protein